MNVQRLCLLILVLAVLFSSIRIAWQYYKQPRAERPHAWRIAALLILQFASAALLYFCVFPPARQSFAERLVVLSANADASIVKRSKGRVLALPEAPAFAGIERVADLAGALRKHPGTNHITVLGEGLPLRDIEAARHVSVSYVPSKLPEGFIALSWTERVSPGMRWRLSGRTNFTAPMHIELLDPANTVVDRSLADKDGRFSLSDSARVAGQANYRVRAIDTRKKVAEDLVVPLTVESSKALRVLSLAGGPNPELKYLRRWASDAGIALESRVELGQGMHIQTANSALSAAGLRELDLLILDERAWGAMSSSNRQMLAEAINAGLGVLLRLTGAMPGAAAGDLQRLGFSITDSAIAQGVRLPEPQDKQLLPELSRRPVRVQSRNGITLLQTDNAEPLAVWRAQGQGRIAVWWLTDSYKLALGNAAERHGQLWSEAASVLARARPQSGLESRQRHVWVNQRGVYCGLAQSARVLEPDGRISPLVVDRQGTNTGCAAFWPRQAGWHGLTSGAGHLRFYVRASNDAPGLKASAVQQATMQLLANRAPQSKPTSIAVPGSPWPFFWAWLLLTGILWLLERSKWGHRNSGP